MTISVTGCSTWIRQFTSMKYEPPSASTRNSNVPAPTYPTARARPHRRLAHPRGQPSAAGRGAGSPRSASGGGAAPSSPARRGAPRCRGRRRAPGSRRAGRSPGSAPGRPARRRRRPARVARRSRYARAQLARVRAPPASPRPPPPAAALMHHRVADLVGDRLRLGRRRTGPSALPGSTGRPAAAISSRAAALSPSRADHLGRRADELMPCAAQISAKSGSSERKP